MDASAICVHIRNAFELVDLPMEEGDALDESIRLLVSLHEQDWDGIWCAILAERFLAGSIPKVSFIAGNPPWVKWSNLPPEYAELIRERCRANGVFSDDVWTGGIESDISTVITFEVLSKWLEPNGKLAFLMTGTVFANESSLGFRRLRYGGGGEAAFLSVEDFDRVKPFEGVSNHPVLMLCKMDWLPGIPSLTVRGIIAMGGGNRGEFSKALLSSWQQLNRLIGWPYPYMGQMQALG